MEILGYTVSSALIWIVIAVIFAIIEALTMGLTTIWFTIGGVAASFASIAGASVLVQVIVFLCVSIVLLYFTRPLAEKKLKVGTEKTNVESLPGKTALVVKAITPLHTGQVKVQGQIWTAVSDSIDSTLEQGSMVRIIRVEGVKLVVEPFE
ncbi:MAG: NfeD family protein [Bacillota bacterium]|jgi:membrane protein implicated in regulation of membrane protease activity|nr:NfeD family protein [Bacillota bacterium]NLM07869.1 NfeD family protein [Clostridiales Family XIII bacterium]